MSDLFSILERVGTGERYEPGTWHQTAIYAARPIAAINGFRAMGYRNWTHDTAKLVGHVYGEPMESHGEMAFCYDFQRGHGELEILTYSGDNWHDRAVRAGEWGRDGRIPFLSHMSTYVDDVDAVRDAVVGETGWQVIQEFETHDHTSQYLIDNRKRFKECIIGTRHLFGFDIKFIERIIDPK